MLVDSPLPLPQRQSLLFLPFQPTAYHPLWKSLHLTVWPLSGTVTKQQAFQRKLLTSCWPRGERPPRSGTQAPRGHGYAGVAFLAFLVKQGNLEYTTIALYRSAISQPHDPDGSTQLGSLPVVARFMKRVFKIKPP